MTRRRPHAPHVARTTTVAVAVVVVGLLSAGTLAACNDHGGRTASSPAGGRAPARTSSPTAPDTPRVVPSPTPTGSSPTPTSTSGSGSTGADDPTPSPGSLRVARCTADHLAGTLTAGEGGGAGSTFPYLVLKNTGSSPCQLQGWPGVSFVGDDNGTQLGAAATFDRSSPHATVTLLPNGHAHAPLRITQPRSYPEGACKAKKADGLRVYVPGETHSIFVRTTGLMACANSKLELLQTQAIQPGAD